ncbi:Uncharacterized membrane protein [Halobacillus karajensis]|uniref:DUF2254 domain-containing protein n=1 Tax=Halobacillus karajensis TaxID=195088 RepID=UPI0008A74597|nr:DUF2254 domain-containing protein [Halobacillus karajensis]SEI12138.1 Uncharacterized membrane protein [Halobacillus karajensis]
MGVNLKQETKKYFNMSKRERWIYKFSNLWLTPVIFSVMAFILFLFTSWVDLWMNVGSLVPSFLNPSYELTRNILSTLTAGLLSLTSFTFYGVLTALTTFSGQFSPRILRNFMITKRTQRTLGIFIGSFLYVLLSLLFLNKEANYFFIPTFATIVAVISLGAFVVFINHIITWLQITNMTLDMKTESINIMDNSLIKVLETYRVENINVVKEDIPKSEGTQVVIQNSGYLQKVDFIGLIQEAKKDAIVLRLEYKVGSFVFNSTPLFTYWKKSASSENIDIEKYMDMFRFGKKQTEIQDIEFSLNKFVEIAIRALGNHDPKTASGTIYQLGDLLINISQNANFTPYLVDNQRNLRVILKSLKFEDYLYISFASIRHYSRKNIVVTMDLLNVLHAIAQAVRARDHQSVWEFVVYTVKGFEQEYVHSLDRKKFYYILWEIASITDNKAGYYNIVDKTLSAISDREELREAKSIAYPEFERKENSFNAED